MNIRPIGPDDLPAVKAVLDSTELFPSEMLPEMISSFLSDEESADIWFTAEVDGEPVSLAYAIPEQLTDGTWNLLAIAVLPSKQGAGIGRAMVTHLETVLRARGERILIVETSGLPEYARTRAFYHKNGYTEEARIRDFYAPGDDKVVFWKALK